MPLCMFDLYFFLFLLFVFSFSFFSFIDNIFFLTYYILIMVSSLSTPRSSPPLLPS